MVWGRRTPWTDADQTFTICTPLLMGHDADVSVGMTWGAGHPLSSPAAAIVVTVSLNREDVSGQSTDQTMQHYVIICPIATAYSMGLVLLRISNPQPNLRILSESVRVRIRESFAAVSDGFGSSVRKSIFTYQVAAFKRRCVTVCGRQCIHVWD